MGVLFPEMFNYYCHVWATNLPNYFTEYESLEF